MVPSLELQAIEDEAVNRIISSRLVSVVAWPVTYFFHRKDFAIDVFTGNEVTVF